MNILIKILKNDENNVWITFLVFDTFFSAKCMLVKSERLKIGLKTSESYKGYNNTIRDTTIFAIQEQHRAIKFAIKTSIFQNYW